MGNWEDYVFSGTNTLKNKFGITDGLELNKKEEEIVLYRLSELIYNGLDGNFDSKHLCDIHRYLFSDLYDFAGSYRTILMFKTTGFMHPDDISSKLEELIEKVNNTSVNEDNQFEIARFIANYYYELIHIHPFREGNGRTIREFIREFVSFRFPKYELDYSRVDKQNFLDGVIYRNQYPLLLAFEINNALIESKVKKI